MVGLAAPAAPCCFGTPEQTIRELEILACQDGVDAYRAEIEARWDSYETHRGPITPGDPYEKFVGMWNEELLDKMRAAHAERMATLKTWNSSDLLARHYSENDPGVLVTARARRIYQIDWRRDPDEDSWLALLIPATPSEGDELYFVAMAEPSCGDLDVGDRVVFHSVLNGCCRGDEPDMVPSTSCLFQLRRLQQLPHGFEESGTHCPGGEGCCCEMPYGQGREWPGCAPGLECRREATPLAAYSNQVCAPNGLSAEARQPLHPTQPSYCGVEIP